MKLTQRTTATGVTLSNTYIHVVNTNDISQDPAGSSYKAPLSLLSPLFSSGTFTGNTSATCISDIYVINLNGCSTNNTVYVPTLALTTIRDYVNDAAADADTTLDSGGLYTITGSRAVYRKP